MKKLLYPFLGNQILIVFQIEILRVYFHLGLYKTDGLENVD